MVIRVPGEARRERRRVRPGTPFLTPGLLLSLATALLAVGAGCAVGHVEGARARSSPVEVRLVPQGPSTWSGRTTPAHGSASGRASASGAASAEHTPGALPSPSASVYRPTGVVSHGSRLTGTTATAVPSASASSAPAVFLPVGACVAAATGSAGASYGAADCSAGDASAVVIQRLAPGTPATSCPSGTDFALQITSIATDGAGTAARKSKAQVTGIACLRNLHAPHPGDPGGGGGFGIVVGDCMKDTGGGSQQETACDATGADRPDYRIIGLVSRDSQCPAATTAFITVHNPNSPVQVACAISLRSGG
ncbi:hypothetical protein EDD99_5127 [Streptomyces sp. 846.5]|nr:hypothetical protein [Streptomyces sp. 846.5]TDU06565.1 hypothetical protein EDD99_5127 [Streptomyces sp. 846.5]